MKAPDVIDARAQCVADSRRSIAPLAWVSAGLSIAILALAIAVASTATGAELIWSGNPSVSVLTIFETNCPIMAYDQFADRLAQVRNRMIYLRAGSPPERTDLVPLTAFDADIIFLSDSIRCLRETSAAIKGRFQ